MTKSVRITLGVAAALLALVLAGCNLPRLIPGGGETDPGSGDGGRPVGPTNTDGAEVILIPGGSFIMGSLSDDPLADDDELPAHEVTLQSFNLYTHEVTNEMYAECVDAGACFPVAAMESGPTLHYDDPAFADFPVVGVDWNMADEYCTWAGGRLPTEAEWELAARGPDSLAYPWGDEDPACDRLNMIGCLVPPDTVEVGSYLLGNSPDEVWDLAGNVWEWVHDWYDADTYALSPLADPLGPNLPEDPADPAKVVRGGGLYSDPARVRGAGRAEGNPFHAYDDVGFRCVAEAPLDLPADYADVPDRHERVEPDPLEGGGEPLEDPDPGEPDWWLEEFGAYASCPDEAGILTVTLGIDAPEGTVFNASTGDGFTACSYDAAHDRLTCWIPTPPGYVPGEPFDLSLRITPPGMGGFMGVTYTVETTADCDPLAAWLLAMEAHCPDGDFIPVSIVTDLAITWDRVESEGNLLACWAVTEFETVCLLPIDPLDPGRVSYPVDVHGTGPGGVVHVGGRILSIPADCPSEEGFTTVETFCFEGQPTVHIHFGPPGTLLGGVLTAGVPLPCIGMTPEDKYCGPLPGTAGSPLPLTTCLIGESCLEWELTVPGCSGPADWYYDEVMPVCYPGLGAAAVIHYTPADLPLVAANANGFDLACIAAPEPGWYLCSGIPGAAGSTMDISFCLSDGTCFTNPMLVPDCAEEEGSGWIISNYGCHDTTRTFVSFDTHLDWLVPGAEFTYSVSDGETNYTCDVHPTVPGRIYCSGLRPETPGTLEACVTQAGASGPTCASFPEYPGIVAAIPDCNPPPEEPVDPCAAYTDHLTCDQDHKGECHWVYTADPPYCESVP